MEDVINSLSVASTPVYHSRIGPSATSASISLRTRPMSSSRWSGGSPAVSIGRPTRMLTVTGLMIQLPEPTVVGSVTVAVSSTGTQVQIRSASSSSPATLEDTTLLTGPTQLKPGTNTIEVPAGEPTSNLLVWISTMGQTGGKSRTDISEITVRAAS